MPIFKSCTTLGFPSEEGLKRHHRGQLCVVGSITTLGFPSEEGLKHPIKVEFTEEVVLPLWDFHQKKD